MLPATYREKTFVKGYGKLRLWEVSVQRREESGRA